MFYNKQKNYLGGTKMKKTILYSLGILTAFTLILGNANTPKETQVSSEEVVQYSHGHTGG